MLGDFGGNFFPIFVVASISSHGDAVGGVVLINKGVVVGESEYSFGVLNGETRDAWEVTEIGVRLRMFFGIFGFVSFLVGDNWVFTAFIGAHLLEDTLIFDVALVVFTFVIPEFGVFCGIAALFAVCPIYISEVEAGIK